MKFVDKLSDKQAFSIENSKEQAAIFAFFTEPSPTALSCLFFIAYCIFLHNLLKRTFSKIHFPAPEELKTLAIDQVLPSWIYNSPLFYGFFTLQNFSDEDG